MQGFFKVVECPLDFSPYIISLKHQQAIYTFLSVVIKAIFRMGLDGILTHIVVSTDGMIIDAFYM